jgi:glycosyltransferase involved in cell wall biosynthesis
LVSVVVATYGRASLLPRLVAALEAQQGGESFEVIIVDDCSRDETDAVLRRLAATTSLDLRHYRLDTNYGPATARNLGWRHARGEQILFTDDDCTPQPGWVAAMAKGLAEADIVQGKTLPDPAQAANLGPFSHTMHVKGENGLYATCNIGYRRGVLERVGGFDERFRHPYGEDSDLAWRAREAGAATAFERAALVYHDVRPPSARAHLRDLRRRGGIVRLVAVHPGMRSRLERGVFLRASHPPALLAGSGLALLFGGHRPRTRLLGAALVLPYVRHRHHHPLPGSADSSVADLALALASDLAEIGVLALASVRARTLVL